MILKPGVKYIKVCSALSNGASSVIFRKPSLASMASVVDSPNFVGKTASHVAFSI